MRIKALNILALMLLTICAACGGGGGGGGGSGPQPTTGTLAVTVTEAGTVPADPVAGARVEVIDGDTGDILSVLTTGADGKATAKYTPRQVTLKVFAQGYEPSPASPNMQPLPYEIALGQTTTADISLDPLDPAIVDTLGKISGKVTVDALGVEDAVVFANSGQTWLSATTNADGDYVIFNVPAGTVALSAYSTGYNFDQINVTVTAGVRTENANMASLGAASGSVSGVVTFVAAENGIVDVTLLHPGTRKVIPGMSVLIDAETRAYSMTGVPDGTFEIIASLKTDNYVLDPDFIIKEGVPTVTIAGNAQTMDFKVTDTFAITAPLKMETVPLDEVAFSWNQYPGVTEGYALEVKNESGKVIWGGFDETGVPRYFVTPDRLTAAFNEDGSAETALEEGRIYQFRAYAMKSDNSPLGFFLISMTEDLEGLFVAGPATP